MSNQLEQSFNVVFRGKIIGHYRADMIVEETLLIELKCCKNILPEHQAQVINYLKTTNIPVGLLVNFGSPKIDLRRLHHPDQFPQNDSEIYSFNKFGLLP